MNVVIVHKLLIISPYSLPTSFSENVYLFCLSISNNQK